jgi:hypothetical protein
MRPTRALVLAVTALLLAGCAGGDQSGSPSTKLREFNVGTGLGASIASLRTTSANAAGALASGASTNSLHTVCGVLLLATEQANGNLPSPDPTLTSLLAKAYDEMGAAANDCYGAAGSPAKRAAFDVRHHLSLSLLAEAQARAEAILGGALTTQTTVPANGAQ